MRIRRAGRSDIQAIDGYVDGALSGEPSRVAHPVLEATGVGGGSIEISDRIKTIVGLNEKTVSGAADLAMATPSHITALIELSREDRYLEYKESRPWNDLKTKIVRTAMGMANIRDGGTIFVGVAKKGT